MHEFLPLKVKICKHTRKRYHYLELWSHEMNIYKVRSVTILYKNMHLHGNPGSIYHLLLNVQKASYTISASIFVDVPYWTPYTTDKCFSCVAPGPSQWVFHFGEEIVIARTQEKTTTLGGTEPHHSSWQCKKSHRCCYGPLAPLAMGDSGTSTVLTRNVSTLRHGWR